ncbi:hypothetical protein ElyMa_004350400 [Elysia marginata]|uniref:Uncharacterized protein n=1 Tax=Elysia marginata TaxID=1093978 RepID=A0AAV4H4D1_9GAST|nr:hypothetical protein ElyMa_004350400 [Elysia marginata]
MSLKRRFRSTRQISLLDLLTLYLGSNSLGTNFLHQPSPCRSQLQPELQLPRLDLLLPLPLPSLPPSPLADAGILQRFLHRCCRRSCRSSPVRPRISATTGTDTARLLQFV